jgi:LuxR family maltose regulon positive regulatory protein
MTTGVSVIEQQADAGRTDSQAVTESRSVGELFAHKFFAPPIYAGALRRDKIAERIFNNASVRVILLQGAAGHGKSTTLQQIKSGQDAKGWAYSVADTR